MVLNRINIVMMILCLTAGIAAGQKTLVYDDPYLNYKEGVDLFHQKQYAAAKRLFLKTIEQEQELVGNKNQSIHKSAQYYAAICAVELFQPDAERLLLDVMDEYGEYPLKRRAYYHLARYYFRERSYSNAVKYYEKVDVKDLETEEVAEYKFELGYCYFYRKHFDEADKQFKQIINIQNKYYYPANYYHGYIAFQQKDFDEALESFDKIRDSKVYEKIIPYYISQIYYYKGQYDKLTEYLEPKLTPDLKYYRELNQILGQAYFEQKDYDKAIRYLTVYITNSSSVRKEDIYQLGYAYYKTKDYEEAIIQFEQLDNQKDSLAQNALYLLGDSYLKTNNKINARSAFERAAKLDIDPYITEHALFNYGKLSYELGYDREAISTLQEYISKYENSENAIEAKELLTELFLNTRDFQEAIRVIESVPNKTNKIKKAYQTVTYYRGLELYNDQEYQEAISAFNTSLDYPIDDNNKAMCHYWLGESYYQLEDYPEASLEYNQFISLSKVGDMEQKDWYVANAFYGAGYAQLKQEKYQQALPYFSQCVEKARNTDKALRDKILQDALMRSADCNFMVKNYNAALAGYSEIIGNRYRGSDYALYQKGIILGLTDKPDEKISTLQKIEQQFPNSHYVDDALFEIGKTYNEQRKFESAIQIFKKITNNYRNSIYLTKAYMRLGLIYYNENKVDEAIESYRKVIELYPQSNDARQAYEQIKQISIAEGLPLPKIRGFQPTASELDSITYQTAETQYFNGNCDKAITKFNEYLDRFKDGFFRLPAHFYRGECHFSSEDYDQAQEDYKFVIDAGKNRFTEKALAKASRIAFFNQKDYELARRYYKLLLENAAFKENIYAAQLGLMRTNYLLGNLEEAGNYAQVIASSDQALPDHIIEAEFYLAKVAFANENYDEAKRLFQKTADATTNVIGSESKYMVAEISYLRGNYDESMEHCYDLIEQKPAHEYWRVKAFILLADNYYQQGNIFQAKATLQSIVDKYKGEELKSIAQEKLDKIIAEEEAEKTVTIKEDTGSVIEVDTSENIEITTPNLEEDEDE